MRNFKLIGATASRSRSRSRLLRQQRLAVAVTVAAAVGCAPAAWGAAASEELQLAATFAVRRLVLAALMAATTLPDGEADDMLVAAIATDTVKAWALPEDWRSAVLSATATVTAADTTETITTPTMITTMAATTAVHPMLSQLARATVTAPSVTSLMIRLRGLISATTV